LTVTVPKESDVFKANYDIDKLCCVGEYRLLVNHPHLITKQLRGADFGMLIKTKKNMLRTLYWAKLIRKTVENSETSVVYTARYEFNSDLRSWHYPTSGKFKPEDKHCFSVTVLGLSFSNKKTLINMTNLRDPSTLGLEYENDIFHPIAHFDSPCFQFRLYRPLNMEHRDTEPKDTAKQSSSEPRSFSPIDKVLGEDIETEKDELAGTPLKPLGDLPSSTPVEFVGQSSSLKPSENVKLIPPKKKPPTNNTTAKFTPGQMILGLPSYIFEGIDFSLPTLQRYGLDVSHLNLDTNVIDGLPKTSIISSIVSSRLPSLTSSKIYFLPTQLQENYLHQTNDATKRFHFPYNPQNLTNSQKLIYQHLPLQNLGYFYKKCSDNPLKINDYCPLVYRLFHPIVSQEYQLQAYKTQFANTFKKFMGDYNPVLIRYVIDFWLCRISFPIAIEPILLYFHHFSNKQHLYAKNRIQNILLKSFAKEFEFPLNSSVSQSNNGDDNNNDYDYDELEMEDENDKTINFQLRKKQFSFLTLLNDFEPLIRLESFTEKDIAKKNLPRSKTITKDDHHHEEAAAEEEGEDCEGEKPAEAEEDCSLAIDKNRTKTLGDDSAFRRVTRRGSKEFDSHSPSLTTPATTTTATTTSYSSSSNQREDPASTSSLSSSNERPEKISVTSSSSSSSSENHQTAHLPAVTNDEFRFWLQYLELYQDSTVSPIERYDLGIRSKVDKLKLLLSEADYARFHRLHSIFGPQFDECSGSLQLLRLIFSFSEITKRAEPKRASPISSIPVSSQAWFSHYFPPTQSTSATSAPTLPKQPPLPSTSSEPLSQIPTPSAPQQLHQEPENGEMEVEEKGNVEGGEGSADRGDAMEVEESDPVITVQAPLPAEITPLATKPEKETQQQLADQFPPPDRNGNGGDIVILPTTSTAGDPVPVVRKKRGRPSLKDKLQAAALSLPAPSSPVPASGLKRTRR
jgi:hypothetical protein